MRAIVLFVLALFCVANANILCPICKGLLSGLETYVQNHDGEKIISLIEKQCAKIDSGILAGVCNKVTEFGIHKLVDLLLNNVKPEAACAAIHCC